MKGYWIREIGWQYNDSNWERDGEYLLAEIMDDYQSAVQRKGELERNAFLHYFSVIFRFEIGADDMTLWGNCEGLLNFMVEVLKANPVIILGSLRSPDITQLGVVPTDEQVDKMIALSGLEFYRIIEVKNSSTFKLITAKMEYNDWDDGFLTDYNGDQLLYFNNKREAFNRYVNFNQDLYGDLYTVNKEKRLKGTCNELSDFPQQLEDLIVSSGFLNYEAEVLTIDYKIDIDTIFLLNSLLKNPLLSYQEVEFNEELMIPSQRIAYRQKEAHDKLERLKESIAQYGSNEKWQASEEFLQKFTFGIGMFSSLGVHDLIKTTWEAKVGTGRISGGNDTYCLRVDGHELNFRSTLRKFSSTDTGIDLACDFTAYYNRKRINGKVIPGTGNDVRQAAFNCFKNWIRSCNQEELEAFLSESKNQ